MALKADLTLAMVYHDALMVSSTDLTLGMARFADAVTARAWLAGVISPAGMGTLEERFSSAELDDVVVYAVKLHKWRRPVFGRVLERGGSQHRLPLLRLALVAHYAAEGRPSLVMRNWRVRSAIWSAWSSRAKWPASSRCTSASGASRW
jgi:hypothetical protein